jgi:hypothetical protein
MGKSLKKIADPLNLPDPMDLWGEKAAKAQKDAKEQAALDREAMQGSQVNNPTMAGEEVSAAREAERQRKLALAGQNGTILTSPSGAASANTGIKTLLGS